MTIGFFQGLSYPLRGARFVYVQHFALIRFWIVPVLLTATALALSLYWAFNYGEEVATGLWAIPSSDGFWGKVLAGLHLVYRGLVALLLFMVGTLLSVACSTILAAPFNEALSREVERLSTGGAKPEGPNVGLIVDLGRTMALEAVKLSVYCGVMVPLFLIGWVLPAVGHVVSSPVALALSVLFLAVDYVDWPAARRNWTVRQRFGLLRQYPMLMTGFGLGVWVLLFVPLLNLLFMPAAVAGGTLMFLFEIKNPPAGAAAPSPATTTPASGGAAPSTPVAKAEPEAKSAGPADKQGAS